MCVCVHPCPTTPYHTTSLSHQTVPYHIPVPPHRIIPHPCPIKLYHTTSLSHHAISDHIPVPSKRIIPHPCPSTPYHTTSLSHHTTCVPSHHMHVPPHYNFFLSQHSTVHPCPITPHPCPITPHVSHHTTCVSHHTIIYFCPSTAQCIPVPSHHIPVPSHHIPVPSHHMHVSLQGITTHPCDIKVCSIFYLNTYQAPRLEMSPKHFTTATIALVTSSEHIHCPPVVCNSKYVTSFTQHVLNSHRSGHSAVWLLNSWCHMKLLLSWHTFRGHHATMHQFTLSLYLKPAM